MDLRTITLGVPPQEVDNNAALQNTHVMSGVDQGQRHRECGRGGVLQGQQRHRQRR